MAITSCSTHSCAISSSSERENTFPVGLCGVLTTMARVLEVNAERSASGSNDQSGGRSVTYRGLAQLRRAPRGRVLVEPIPERKRCRLENPRIGGEIRKALSEVDRPLGSVEGQVQP